jgi:hypothetical protein
MADLAAQPSINDARTQALLALLQRLDAMDLTPLLVYRIDSVDASVLPWLAWQFDLNSEFWLLLDNVNQRTLLKEAILLHQRRGTPWAITTALASLGYPNATILEGQNSWGGSGWPATEGWAVNRIVIPIPTGGIPAGIPAQIIAAFNFFKPARSWLDSLMWTLPAISDAAPDPVDRGIHLGGKRLVMDLAPDPSDAVDMTSMLLSDGYPVVVPLYDGHFYYSGGINYGSNEPEIADSGLTIDGVAQSQDGGL